MYDASILIKQLRKSMFSHRSKSNTDLPNPVCKTVITRGFELWITVDE